MVTLWRRAPASSLAGLVFFGSPRRASQERARPLPALAARGLAVRPVRGRSAAGDQPVARRPLAELGVDSLQAIALQYQVLEQLLVDVPIEDLLGGRTVAELAVHLDALAARCHWCDCDRDSPPTHRQRMLREIESRGLRLGVSGADLRLQGPRERIDPALVARIKAVKPSLSAPRPRAAPAEAGRACGLPLTLLQRGFLIGRGDAVEMGNVASYVFHEIAGRWDVDRLETSLQQLVARHGMLRRSSPATGRQVELPPRPPRRSGSGGGPARSTAPASGRAGRDCAPSGRTASCPPTGGADARRRRRPAAPTTRCCCTSATTG